MEQPLLPAAASAPLEHLHRASVCGVRNTSGKSTVECVQCYCLSYIQCARLTLCRAKQSRFLCHRCRPLAATKHSRTETPVHRPQSCIYQQLLASSKFEKLSSTNLLWYNNSMLLTLPSLYTYLPDLPASTSPLNQLLFPCHLHHYQALEPLYHCPPPGCH